MTRRCLRCRDRCRLAELVTLPDGHGRSPWPSTCARCVRARLVELEGDPHPAASTLAAQLRTALTMHAETRHAVPAARPAPTDDPGG